MNFSEAIPGMWFGPSLKVGEKVINYLTQNKKINFNYTKNYVIIEQVIYRKHAMLILTRLANSRPKWHSKWEWTFRTLLQWNGEKKFSIALEALNSTQIDAHFSAQRASERLIAGVVGKTFCFHKYSHLMERCGRRKGRVGIVFYVTALESFCFWN